LSYASRGFKRCTAGTDAQREPANFLRRSSKRITQGEDRLPVSWLPFRQSSE